MNKTAITKIDNMLGMLPNVGITVQILEKISPNPFQKVDHIIDKF